MALHVAISSGILGFGRPIHLAPCHCTFAKRRRPRLSPVVLAAGRTADRHVEVGVRPINPVAV